ncbi:MAG TPA: LysE family translocator [Nitrolancea sp.]|nr:LysE family translocator [Nitrolancea sp.]
MTTGQAIAFVLFAVVAAITPGPSNLILTSTGAAVGVTRGLPALLGQVFGMGLMLFLVAFGLGSLVLESSLILQLLKWCGIAFLLWLAWKIATAGRHNATANRTRAGFWQLAAFQWINPKSWLICASVAGTYFAAESGSTFVRAALLALLFIVAALPSCFVWLATGASMQRLLRTERAASIFNVTMGALLACSVLLILR